MALRKEDIANTKVWTGGDKALFEAILKVVCDLGYEPYDLGDKAPRGYCGLYIHVTNTYCTASETESKLPGTTFKENARAERQPGFYLPKLEISPYKDYKMAICQYGEPIFDAIQNALFSLGAEWQTSKKALIPYVASYPYLLIQRGVITRCSESTFKSIGGQEIFIHQLETATKTIDNEANNQKVQGSANPESGREGSSPGRRKCHPSKFAAARGYSGNAVGRLPCRRKVISSKVCGTALKLSSFSSS